MLWNLYAGYASLIVSKTFSSDHIWSVPAQYFAKCNFLTDGLMPNPALLGGDILRHFHPPLSNSTERVHLEKLAVALLDLAFYTALGLSPCLQDLVTGPCPQPHHSGPQFATRFSKAPFCYSPSAYCGIFLVVSSLQAFQPNLLLHC